MVKIGICIDCPEGSKPKPLIAKRCQSHYWPYRAAIKSEKKENKDREFKKKENSVFYASQILQCPPNCENCGKPLRQTINLLGHRAVIAHIVPKRKNYGCPSVSLHPLNRLFLCGDCHTNMDNKGSDYVVKMKCFPLMVERFKVFESDIDPSELKNIPAYLL